MWGHCCNTWHSTSYFFWTPWTNTKCFHQSILSTTVTSSHHLPLNNPALRQGWFKFLPWTNSWNIQSGGILLILVIHPTWKAWSICTWLKFHYSPGYSVTKEHTGSKLTYFYKLQSFSTQQAHTVHSSSITCTAYQTGYMKQKYIFTIFFKNSLHQLQSMSYYCSVVTCYCFLLSS